jgi:thioester reductase-like protein
MSGRSIPRLGAGDCLLLSGATGFVGMEILSHYLERTDRQIYTLVRAEDERDAERRIRLALFQLFGDEDAYGGRIGAVRGDIEAPMLGLDRANLESLAGSVADVIHCAASVSFSLSLERSREINVEGTRRMLEFGELCREHGGLAHFAYVSTAYVAGTHEGEFTEDDLDVGQDFHNSYERSKFEAEQLVRRHADRLPIQIFRPSIIVGEHSSGWTMSFNVLYSPLKAFARGALPAIPADPDAPVDVVPVDYVADAVFQLANRPAQRGGETYHLVAGSGATTVGRLVDLFASYLGRRPPLVIPPRLYARLVHPLLIRVRGARNRRALEEMRVFFPYFSMRVNYGDRRTRNRLAPLGIEPPPLEGYYHQLIDFALRAKWGRAPIARAEGRDSGAHSSGARIPSGAGKDLLASARLAGSGTSAPRGAAAGGPEPVCARPRREAQSPDSACGG